MENRSKFILLGFIISQIAIICFSFVQNKDDFLLAYINISFYFSFFLLLISLSIYTIQSGFFNTMVASFRRFGKAHRRQIEEKEIDTITPYSELITFSQFPILVLGLLNGGICGIALFFFYYL
ncbi:DUF3899 domain-containing protein [Bacillus massilinigeriensis]|uniref:DUF3899 domain-containing protein n=1 Tax=Bacillus massilionigeriensis TaxID=1805475 RepID=UPI00096AF9CB|nr:DUF3899 domain-containing protein [Bacillus massilionigeriensis]